MRMVSGGTDTAEVSWRLEGKVRGLPLSVDFVDTLTLNLVTGLVTKHSARWDLGRSNPLARAAFTLERVLWSAKQVGVGCGVWGKRTVL